MADNALVTRFINFSFNQLLHAQNHTKSTIINNYVLITILLTHGTSSKKVNETNLDIDALGFSLAFVPLQLAHIQDPLWAVGMSKLSYILAGQMPTRRYPPQVETSDYLNKPARYDRGLRSHPSYRGGDHVEFFHTRNSPITRLNIVNEFTR